jgi:hypothetical protein
MDLRTRKSAIDNWRRNFRFWGGSKGKGQICKPFNQLLPFGRLARAIINERERVARGKDDWSTATIGPCRHQPYPPMNATKVHKKELFSSQMPLRIDLMDASEEPASYVAYLVSDWLVSATAYATPPLGSLLVALSRSWSFSVAFGRSWSFSVAFGRSQSLLVALSRSWSLLPLGCS